jgi:hypothetical protein
MARTDWFCRDVIRLVFAFLRPADCDQLASVHPRWYSLVRERQITLCIRNDVLHPRSVRRATDMLGAHGPVLQRLSIRFGEDLRAEGRILGVPRDVLGALLATADAGCNASAMEGLRLDLECADAAGMAAAVRIVGQNRGSLRRLALSVGERQLNDTSSVSALGIVLGHLQLEHLAVRVVFDGMRAPGAAGWVASVLDTDTPHVVLDFATGPDFIPGFVRCMKRYHVACEERAGALNHQPRRRLDVVFEDSPHDLTLTCIFLLLKLSLFHALRCDVGCNLPSYWRRTPIQGESFEHSALRVVVLNLFDVNMMNELFVAVLEIVMRLPALETFECDARKNPISEPLFGYHGAYVVPVNATGIRRILVRVTDRPGIRGAAAEWNDWIRTSCPHLSDCDGMLPEPCFSVAQSERRPVMTNRMPSKRPTRYRLPSTPKRIIVGASDSTGGNPPSVPPTDYHSVSSTAERNANEAAERRAVLAQYRS